MFSFLPPASDQGCTCHSRVGYWIILLSEKYHLTASIPKGYWLTGVWALSGCEVKTGQIGPGKFPILSHSRKFKHGIGKLKVQWQLDTNWRMWGFGHREKKLVLFLLLEKQCYERYFSKWVFFPRKLQFFIRNIYLEVFSLILFTCSVGAYGKSTEASRLFSLPSSIWLFLPH